MRPLVELHDASLRDSIGDFVAFHLRAEELCHVVRLLDHAGFASIDAFGGPSFFPSLRVLGEDPWHRLRTFRRVITRTPVQGVVRGRFLFGRWPAPDSTIVATLRHMRSLGVDILKVDDVGLDREGAQRVVRMAKDMHFQVAATVTISWGEAPRARDLLDEAARAYEAAGADCLTLQDPFGLLTPFQVKEAVRHHRARTSLPLRLHIHDVNLLAVASLEAGLEAGAVGADTTLSTLSWSYSPPQAESLVMSLRGSPHETGVDLSPLEEAANWFEAAKGRKGFRYKAVYGVDHAAFRGEMPSAVRRILNDILREQGRVSLMDRAWAEIPKVWEALGRPTLLAPLVQGICQQALNNLLSEEPYQKLDYRVVAYLKGEFGPPRPGTRSDLRRQAEGEAISGSTRPLDIDKLSPETFASEDDRITFACFPNIASDFFRRREGGEGGAESAEFFTPQGPETPTPAFVPRSLTVKRHGEAFTVVLEGMGPREGNKRMLFLRIGGEAAKIEVTFPEDGAPPAYQIFHHGKRHSIEFVEILHPGRKSLPVILREDDRLEEVLFSLPTK